MTKAQIADLAKDLGYAGVTAEKTKQAMIQAFMDAQEGQYES